MKRKFLLLVCAVLTSVGAWAYTNQTPSAGNTYYLYHPTLGQFLFVGENKYGVTPSVFNATPIYVETGTSGNSNWTFSFVIRGTKYYIYQNKGNGSLNTSSGSEFEPKLSGDKYRLQTEKDDPWIGAVTYRCLHAGTSGGQCSFEKYESSGSNGYEWQFISESEVESARSAMAESCASSAASYATTSNGWERVTSISALQTNPENYYYAIFCANATGLMLQATSNNSETQKLYYRTATNPTNSSEYLFEIENHTSGGFALKSFAIGKYFSNATSYDFHANQTSATAGNYTNLTLTYTNGAYTIETAQSTNFVGLWTIISDWYSANKYLAGNKESSLAGKFLIYRLPKQRLRNVSFTANITNPSFETGDKTGWTTNSESSDTNVHAASGTYATTGTDGTYLFNTWWQGVPLSQTIGNIPNGKYRMTVSLAGSDDGKDGKYFLLAEGSHSDVITITQGTKGTFNNYSYDFIVSDNSATIGVVGGNDDGSYNENGHWWYKADNFRLTYIGQLLSEGVGAFTSPSVVTNDAWYNYTVGSAGWYVITSSAATTLSYTTDATKSVGDGGFSTLELAAGVSKCLELTNDPLYFKSSAAATLTITALTSGMDVTSLVTNTTFDSDISGWTATGGFQNSQTASNQSGDFTGNFWENWNGSAKVNKMYQNITNVPNGFYKMKIAAFVNNLAENNSTQYVFVNGGKTYLVTNSPKFYEVWGQVSDNTLSIGLEQTTATANWMGIDNVSLTYFDALPESITPVTGKMKTTVETAQTSAAEAYAAEQTVVNLNAAMKAKAAAEVSKAAYANAASYLDKVEDILETTNFYTSTAYNSVYGTYKTAYDAGTLEGATAAGLTYKVASHTPEAQRYNDNTANKLLIPGWTIGETTASETNSGFYINTWSTEDNSKGFANPFFEYYVGSGSLAATTLTGTISGLTANANYIVTANVRVVGNDKVTNSIKMKVGNDGTTVDVTQGNRIDETSHYVKSYTAVGATDGSGNLTLTFTVDAESNISWLAFRDVNYELGASADQKTALATAITNAESKILGFESGEYAPYNNITVLEALAAAKVLDVDLATAKEVVAATNAIADEKWTANVGDVECVYNGDFSNGQGSAAANIQNYGWTRTNGWGQFRSDSDKSSTSNGTSYYNQPGSLQYGNAGYYTMPLKANTIYQLTFKYASWEANSNNSVTASVLKSGEGMAEVTYEKNATVHTTAGAFVAKTILFVTTTAGDYVLTLANSGNTVITDVSIRKASQTLTLPSATQYAAGTYPSVTLDRTFANTSNWYTLCAPFDFPKSAFAEVKVLDRVTDNAGDVNMTFTDAGSTISAGTPCLVKPASADATLSVEGVAIDPDASADSPSKQDGTTTVTYVGTFEGETIDGSNVDNAWVVSNNALYHVAATHTATVGAYRAYFTVSASEGVKALSYDFGGADAIDDVRSKIEDGRNEIYNLAGQKMSKLQRGVNIVNGKKVLVK